jgi:hypothetical protein
MGEDTRDDARDDASEPVTAAWLTEVLRAGGSLPRGEVVAVQQGANPAFNSSASHLRVVYSADAPATAPTSLFLKRSLPTAWAMRAGALEVAFYRLARGMALPMLVPCYAAERDVEHHTSYLLLQDVSETHCASMTRDQQLTAGENVPSPALLDRVIRALGQFHAFWWEHPLVNGDTGALASWYPTRADAVAMIGRREAAFARLLARDGGKLPREIHHLIERVLAAFLGLWDRYWEPRLCERRNITLTHGDAYFANFLTPRDPASEAPTYLIDWQSPEPQIGAEDLANMLATFWTRAQRREDCREVRLLRRYLETLQTHGVLGYTWDDLRLDYRLALIDWLLVPIQDAGDGSRRDYWWPKLQCLAAAYEDWCCEELLKV